MVDRTGLIVTRVSKFSYVPIEVEELGASVSTIFSASEYQGRNLMLGELKFFTSEFSKSKIFATNCGSNGIIVLISDPKVNIGVIRLILKRSGKVLA